MARLPRLVLPGIPYHVTQRGNRRAQTFFEQADYALYRDLLAQAAERCGAQVWCYCLMPNHVHVIVVPADADGLRRTFADVHRRYTGYINARNRWTGHLWQGRNYGDRNYGNYGDSALNLIICRTFLHAGAELQGAPRRRQSRGPRVPAARPYLPNCWCRQALPARSRPPPDRQRRAAVRRLRRGNGQSS